MKFIRLLKAEERYIDPNKYYAISEDILEHYYLVKGYIPPAFKNLKFTYGDNHIDEFNTFDEAIDTLLNIIIRYDGNIPNAIIEVDEELWSKFKEYKDKLFNHFAKNGEERAKQDVCEFCVSRFPGSMRTLE